MAMQYQHYDSLVIGGGFYGCTVALELSRHKKRVRLLEKGTDLMQRASYINQARIHQGYHYPRSILTAHRSRVNFDRFVREYSECVYSEFEHYYAIGRCFSKISADQFRLFCARIGAPLGRAPKGIKNLFDPRLVEDVFLVREYAFDAVKLKGIMLDALERACINVEFNSRVNCVSPEGDCMKIDYETPAGHATFTADYVFNCTYSQINRIMENSSLSLLPLKHELTEMALTEMPADLQHMGFTVMDGPFFSIMPFPARGLHSLSHVRYTPHHYWQDRMGYPYRDADRYVRTSSPESHHVHMLKDAERYLPALRECRYVESIWEIKTVLPQSEFDDSRPILFKRSQEFPNLVSIMGGKIDNIFDVREKLSEFLAGWQGVQ